MKRFVLITTMVALAGLFTAGQAVAAMDQSGGMSQQGGMSQSGDMSHSGQSSSMSGQMQQGAVAQNLNQDQVRELQKLLKDKGYKVGQVDGVIGKKTQQAIRNFQKSEGLAQSGQPDEKTLRALAPSAEKQEFFGLSPSFGEKNAPVKNQEMEQNKGMEEQKPMEQPTEQQKPQGSGY